MRIYVFKSQSRAKLRAFASDPDINRLPQQHGPWTVTEIIGPTSDPPYRLSRDTIEEAIDAEGFPLWRLRDKTAAQARSGAVDPTLGPGRSTCRECVFPRCGVAGSLRLKPATHARDRLS